MELLFASYAFQYNSVSWLQTEIIVSAINNYNYTVFQKKLHPFYFCDNFVGHEPMLIIFGRNVAKEIGNMQRLTWLLLTVQISYG